MSKLHAWDLDGTIRPGSLLSDGLKHGVDMGLMDEGLIDSVSEPTWNDVVYFIKSVTGRTAHDFRDVMETLTADAIASSYPWAIDTIQQQLEEGDVIILSHSPDFLVRAFAQGLDIHRGHGSYFHTQNLEFSGRTKTLDKRRVLRRYMKNNGYDRLHFAAGDTHYDLPILTVADYAAVVNPDEELAALALERGWEIVTAVHPQL